ncbi:uncharacterized protein C2845_PM02G40150 [Panicum miliaceum]|uniref:Uncharacterized protein n=1 Tax=Panicum miliaceum TaxID=4540 RepID=A0A3L6SE69_PANMI|nr:uncharacterized protein C2845_PM02G40150 [Panicum miliaceum]
MWCGGERSSRASRGASRPHAPPAYGQPSPCHGLYLGLLAGPSVAHWRPRRAVLCVVSLRSPHTACDRQAAAQSGEVAAVHHHRIERMRPPVSRGAFASVLLGRRALGASLVAARCASSAASPAAAVTASDHASFVKEIAATDPPEYLNSLLNVLQARGEMIVSPGAKRGLIPVVVPLSESPAGNLTSLLRWPTAPTGMEMPVVEVRNHGLWLLAKNVKQYIHRILVEADINANAGDDVWAAVGEAGENLYTKGDFKESQLANLDVYLLKKVGLFPDVIERKTLHHLGKGDNVSALITGEFYTRDQFPGFGRPFVFNAEILKRVGRTSEAKDSARVALKSPWWTLGCSYEEAAELAGWEDEQIEFIREKITEEGKREDLKKGKAPEQVVLDEAAFLMDLAYVDGNWDDVVDRIAECYREAGLDDIAKFIAYRE